tara:strand:+ start:56 stop:472 length:417 start_codon:yes stop_codon:yes gene_type:complete
MTKFSTCKLKIAFKFGECNNKLMTVNVNGKTLQPENNQAIYEEEITLPTKVLIQTSGKEDGVDTKVDKDGNILEDMSAILTSLSLDSFELNEIFLYQRMQLVTKNNRSVTGCYFGFNGSVNIDFVEDNVFAQVLSFNS